MKPFQAIRWARLEFGRKWIALGLALVSLAGCQALVAGKAKQQTPLDHFSCGEKVPTRVGNRPPERL